jgi:acyl dehydratase
MSLDLGAVGYQTEPFSFEYDFKTTILYALGIGCTENDLDYLYEGRGPKVVPSFAVVPAYSALEPLVRKAGADMTKVVHGGQSITLHAPIPAAAHLKTIAKIEGIYDFKRLSQVVFSTQSFQKDQLIFETEWMLVVRDTGGFGGPRPPKNRIVKLPGDQTPTFQKRETIPKTQALLYRLSGDLNPLHADPAFASSVGFDQGPILHGLCTFGYVTRALVAGACGGDPSLLRHLNVQFKKPVWPGEVIKVEGFEADQTTVALAAYADERPEAVVGGWAEVLRP